MENPTIIQKFIDLYEIIIPIIVVKELDNLKNSINTEKSSQAKKAIKELNKYKDVLTFDLAEDNYKDLKQNDDIILYCASVNAAEIITNDLAMKIKAKCLGIPCIEIYNEKENYNGYKTVLLNNSKMAELYTNVDINHFNCLINEYVIIQNEQGEIVDKLKWDGLKYQNIKYKQIESKSMGRIKPKNVEQELLLDLLFDDSIPIKVITGRYGSGKTLLSSAMALSLVDAGKYSNILYLRNNYAVKDTKEIGALPGTKNEKLYPFVSPLADHVGGEYGLQELINSHKLEIEHLGFLRGRNLANQIVMINEAENLTPDHIQLILSRIAEGSEVWFDGDTKQVDNKIFEKNNGLDVMIDKLKGNPLFGCVRLAKTERSPVSALAEQIKE